MVKNRKKSKKSILLTDHRTFFIRCSERAGRDLKLKPNITIIGGVNCKLSSFL